MRNQYIPKTPARTAKNLEDEMLLTSTQNMIHGIATIDVLFLKVILDFLSETFQGYYYDFDDVRRNFMNVKKYYTSLSEEDRRNKGITDDLIKYKACAYHLYKKIKNIEIVDESNAKLISKINNTLSHTLQTFNRITNRCDLQNETLYKVLADKLYNNLRYANLITKEELEKLIN